MSQTIQFTTQQLLALAQGLGSGSGSRLNISPQSQQLAEAETRINLSFTRGQITYPLPPQLSEPQQINTLRIDSVTYTNKIEWSRAWTRIYNDNYSSLVSRPQGPQPATIENIVNSQGVSLQRLVAAQPLPTASTGTAATLLSPTQVNTSLLQGSYIGAQGPAGAPGRPGPSVRSAALIDGVLTFTLTDDTVIPATGSVIGSPGPQGPQGIQGIVGPTGPAPNITIGTVSTTAVPEVTVTGSSPDYVLNFGLKQGAPGPTGPAANFTIGTVTSGASPAVTISGSAPNYTLNFTLQAGPPGPGSGDVSTLSLYANPSWITSLSAAKITGLSASSVGLGNVTNESKATMFSSPTFTGSVTIESVTTTGATGSGKIVFSNSPTFTGTVSGISAAMVGLGNVTNESKSTMLANAALTGVPTAPTAAGGTNTTQIATTAFVASAVTAASLPSGVILMWSGTIATIPAGFVLCDGNNSTPDLRDRFIVGATVDSLGQSRTNITSTFTKTGGTTDTTLVSHSHTATVSENNHTHTYTLPVWRGANGGNTSPAWGGGDRQDASNVVGTSSGAKTNLSVSISTEGSSAAYANLPPYFALAFIMKT